MSRIITYSNGEVIVNIRHIYLGMIGFLTIGGVGCSSEPREKAVFPVQGQVLYENKPMAKAVIVFHNADSADRTTPGHATADEQGRYKVHTYRVDDGAPAGDYIVTIYWPGTAPKSAGKSTVSPDADDSTSGSVIDRLQGRYSLVDKSPLRATVKPEENTINFNLPIK